MIDEQGFLQLNGKEPPHNSNPARLVRAAASRASCRAQSTKINKSLCLDWWRPGAAAPEGKGVLLLQSTYIHVNLRPTTPMSCAVWTQEIDFLHAQNSPRSASLFCTPTTCTLTRLHYLRLMGLRLAPQQRSALSRLSPAGNYRSPVAIGPMDIRLRACYVKAVGRG